MSGPTQNSSLLSLVVFVAGLVAATASGIATYRAVGIYGGPVASGFHREWDPVTKRRQLVHEQVLKSGTVVKRFHNDDLSVRLAELPSQEVTIGLATSPSGSIVARVGFSIANDGVIDAWATNDPKTGQKRVEVSTKRNGKVDRWEYYKDDQLLRVELDTNGNEKPDRWMTYQAGILMATVIDANEDGQPDSQ